MKKVIREFSYRINVLYTLLAGLFFVPCAALFIYKAINNDRGLIINGIIKLDPGQADFFYWVLAVFSVLFVIAALYAVVMPLFIKNSGKLIVYEEGVSYPRGKAQIEFLWNEINDIKTTEVSGTVILEFISVTGRKYAVNNRMFKNKKEFEEFCGLVKENYRA